MICGVCHVWRNRLYVKGVRPRPLTCGKGGDVTPIRLTALGQRLGPFLFNFFYFSLFLIK